MQEASIDIIFEPRKTGDTRGRLLVKQNGEVIHSDVLDIAKDKDLTVFLKKLKKQCPTIDTEQVRKLILAEVARISKEKTQVGEQAATEVKAMRIVRPHLFHIPEVSGLLVPTIRLSGGKPQGQWLLYIQWADGKRECRELEQYLTLPNNERIWFASIPNSPRIDMATGWSVEGRRKWLQGDTPDAVSIFKNLTETINHYLEFPVEEAPGHLATLSLWTILTYAYPAWPAVPYIWVCGPPGSGKTRVFDIESQIIYRPLASSNMTAPCLFRTLDAQGGTLLLDEAERLKERSPEAAEMRSILLSGYKVGGTAHRMEKSGESFRSVAFNVYGPKAIAGINDLTPALASRCICITMFKAGKNSPKPSRRIDKDSQKWIALADDLHCFALTNGQRFVETAQEYISCEGISGRDMEVWQPIFALAKLVEKAGAIGLLDLIKKHAKHLVGKTLQDTIAEADETLLQVLCELLDSEPSGVTANQVLTKAKEKDNSTFNFFSPRGIGSVLKRYGIISNRVGGKRLFRPSEKQLLAIQESYGIDLVPASVVGTLEKDCIENTLAT